MNQQPNQVSSFNVQRNIFLGLFILIPLGLTLYFAYYIFLLLTKFTYPIVADYLAIGSNNTMVMYAYSFVLSLAIIYAIGLVGSMWFGNAVLNLVNNLIQNIPVVGSFYRSIKQLADTFNQSDKNTQKVVLINFPNERMKTIGFVIKTMEDAETKQMWASVFVPTTPNPTSGYLEIMLLSDTTPLDWTFEEAMSFIISGGSSMPNKKLPLR
jgi:uncharacterized membrane protein